MAAHAGSSRQPGKKRMLRFPCGHLEPARVVGRRTRVGADVVWVRCRKCNLIALMVATTTKTAPLHPHA